MLFIRRYGLVVSLFICLADYSATGFRVILVVDHQQFADLLHIRLFFCGFTCRLRFRFGFSFMSFSCAILVTFRSYMICLRSKSMCLFLNNHLIDRWLSLRVIRWREMSSGKGKKGKRPAMTQDNVKILVKTHRST